MERREFLRKSTVVAGSVVAGGVLPQAEATENACPCASNAAKLPQRAYGDTGARLSIIGFGGIVVSRVEQEHANRVVAEAVEKGVNYFDVAPSYGDAESKLGPALEPYRKNVFLACKTERSEAKLALYFTLSQPITAAIPPGEESLFRLALDLAMGFRPISQKEVETLRQMAQPLAPVFPA